MNFLFNPNYNKLYNVYKILPGISAVALSVLTFIWSIVDVCVFSRESYYSTYYGVMHLPSPVLCFLIWWAIGIAASFIIWFFSSLVVSATVTRTDAILEIKERLTKEN